MIIRIFILEAHSITRAGLRAHLEAASDIHVSGEASDPQAALDAINHAKPGVVLLGAGSTGRRATGSSAGCWTSLRNRRC